MSYNIDSVEILSGELRIHKDSAEEAWNLDPPECMGEYEELKFGKDGYATFKRFDWCGEGSGYSYPDTLAEFIALTKGNADMILTWEGGDSHTGLRVRDGVMMECKVIMTLAPADDE